MAFPECQNITSVERKSFHPEPEFQLKKNHVEEQSVPANLHKALHNDGPPVKPKPTEHILQSTSSKPKVEPKPQKSIPINQEPKIKQKGSQKKEQGPTRTQNTMSQVKSKELDNKREVLKEQVRPVAKDASSKKVTIKTDTNSDRRIKPSTIKTSTPKVSKSMSKLDRLSQLQAQQQRKEPKMSKTSKKKQQVETSSSSEVSDTSDDSGSSSSEEDSDQSKKTKSVKKVTLKKVQKQVIPKRTSKVADAKRESQSSKSGTSATNKINAKDNTLDSKTVSRGSASVKSNQTNNVSSNQIPKDKAESMKKVSGVASKPTPATKLNLATSKRVLPKKPLPKSRKTSVSSSSASSSSSSESDTETSSSESSSSDSDSEDESETSSSSSESSHSSSSSSESSDSDSDESEKVSPKKNGAVNMDIKPPLKKQIKVSEKESTKTTSMAQANSILQTASKNNQTKDGDNHGSNMSATKPLVRLMIPSRRKSKSLSLEASSSGDELAGNEKEEKKEKSKDQNANKKTDKSNEKGNIAEKQGSKPIYRDHQGRNYYAEDFGIDPHQMSDDEVKVIDSKSNKGHRRSRSSSESPQRNKKRDESNSRPKSTKSIPKQYRRSSDQRSSDSKDYRHGQRKPSNSSRSEKHKRSHSDKGSHSSRSRDNHHSKHRSSSGRKRRSSENRHDSSSKLKRQNSLPTSHNSAVSLKTLNTTDFWRKPHSNNPNLLPISNVVPHLHPTTIQANNMNPIQQQTNIATNLMKLASYPTTVPQTSVDLLNSVNIAQQHQLQDQNLLRTIQNEISASQQMMMLINPLNPSKCQFYYLTL